jgi:hypothetical protein
MAQVMSEATAPQPLSTADLWTSALVPAVLTLVAL